MTDKKNCPPPEGTPEYKEWLKRQIAEDVDELFGDECQPADYDETGVLSGSEDLLDKSDADLFPDEDEEYTPEDRRKRFKVHKQDKD